MAVLLNQSGLSKMEDYSILDGDVLDQSLNLSTFLSPHQQKNQEANNLSNQLNTKSGFLPKINLSEAILRSNEKNQPHRDSKFSRPMNQSLINLASTFKQAVELEKNVPENQAYNSSTNHESLKIGLRRNNTETRINFHEMAHQATLEDFSDDGNSDNAIDTPRYDASSSAINFQQISNDRLVESEKIQEQSKTSFRKDSGRNFGRVE